MVDSNHNPEVSPNQSASDEPVLLDHAYDGIQEYDNPLPGWWSWLYIGTVVWGILYFVISIAARGALSPEGFFERAQVQYQQKLFGELGDLTPDEETILAYTQDEAWMNYAASKFASACSSCHSANASGKTGPNLTDNYWIHVKKVTDIADVIKNGRAGGAMPPQENLLHPNEIVLLSSYIASLQGENLPSDRGPEGELLEDGWQLP